MKSVVSLLIVTAVLVELFAFTAVQCVSNEVLVVEPSSTLLDKAFRLRRNIYGGFGHGLAAGGWSGTGVGGQGKLGGVGGYGGLGYNPWPFGGYSPLFG
jgi:hypothetical protein